MDTVDALIGILCKERGEKPQNCPEKLKDRYFRALVNVRPPAPLKPGYEALEGEYLAQKLKERGVVDADSFEYRGGIALWKGDITRLKCDGIVNAANSQLLGCFYPCHGCIDNAIHTFAGAQLRQECARIMAAQGHEEPVGSAKITGAYNLPCRYIIHTVGPTVYGQLTDVHRQQLKSCYLSCLNLAAERGLKSLAFCCISTGEFRFPNGEAAKIAVDTVRTFLAGQGGELKVIFNVFKEVDYEIYSRLLAERS